MNAPLAIVDTETTGVHRERRAWEIAIIRREPNGTEETFHAFVSDVDLTHANLHSLKIGGFYERHPAFADRRKNGAPYSVPVGALFRHESWLAGDIERLTRDAHIVGAVPNFDTEVFADILYRNQLTPAWHYHLIDMENVAVGYLHGRADENPGGGISGAVAALPWSSDDLSRACGVEPPTETERHTALGDARWVMRWYDAVVLGRKEVHA